MITQRKDIIKQLATNINEFSPVVIVGDEGAGKTTFLKELCQELMFNHVVSESAVQNSWDVTYELIDAIANKDGIGFYQKYIKSEIIVIDDFNLLSRRSSTPMALLEIFKSAKMPVVIATTKPIKEINGFEREITSFFERGTHIFLEHPNKKETAMLLKTYFKENGTVLTKDALKWLLHQNIRTLSQVECIVNTLKLNIFKNETGEVELNMCKKALKHIFK